MHILLTNDDGLLAPGLLAAYAGLKGRGHQVTVCAPDCQRSASSQSVTLRKPSKVAPWAMPDGALGFAVYGTPADCTRLGFSVLAKEPVDLVISDLVMPEMDGFELTEAIKNDPVLRKTPVVIISTHADSKYIFRALRLGAADYLTKPPTAEMVGVVLPRVFDPHW